MLTWQPPMESHITILHTRNSDVYVNESNCTHSKISNISRIEQWDIHSHKYSHTSDLGWHKEVKTLINSIHHKVYSWSTHNRGSALPRTLILGFSQSPKSLSGVRSKATYLVSVLLDRNTIFLHVWIICYPLIQVSLSLLNTN